ncbi:MAG: dihydropteroate synthase [Lachnospiraceae bacterium]|nr:dihydropteroate synthase [Lachnospiraceae bacterium]
MIIGNREFNKKGHTYIFGILNVTPDSFSDGGKFNNLDMALKRTEEMIKEGADVIDIGGESTRPGYTRILDEEEIMRVVPVIEAVKREFDIPVSLDTYKSKVAKAGIEAGADLINDIWGLKADSEMAKVISEGKVSCCLMHNRDNTDYDDFLEDVKNDLKESIDMALKAGIGKDRILIDPGVGFAKDVTQNLLVIKYIDEFNKLGYPVLLGHSKKSYIGLSCGYDKNERGVPTAATTVYGAMKGCLFVRVHDIKENVAAIRMIEEIINCDRKIDGEQ